MDTKFIDLEEVEYLLNLGAKIIQVDAKKQPFAPFGTQKELEESSLKTSLEVYMAPLTAWVNPADQGFFCIDIDMKLEKGIDGFELMRSFCEDANIPYDAIFEQHPCSVSTPSGGRHYYFKIPEGFENSLTFTKKVLTKGVDIRGKGNCYIILPGSVRKDGTYSLDGSFKDAPVLSGSFFHAIEKHLQACETYDGAGLSNFLLECGTGLEDFHEIESETLKILKKIDLRLKADSTLLEALIKKYVPNAVKNRRCYEVGGWDGHAGRSLKISIEGEFLGRCVDWAGDTGVEHKPFFSLLKSMGYDYLGIACEILGQEVPRTKTQLVAKKLKRMDQDGKIQKTQEKDKGFSLFTGKVAAIPIEFYSKNATLILSDSLLHWIIDNDLDFKSCIKKDVYDDRLYFHPMYRNIDEFKAAFEGKFAPYGFSLGGNSKKTAYLIERLITKPENRFNSILDFFTRCSEIQKERNEADPIGRFLEFFNFHKFGETGKNASFTENPKVIEAYKKIFEVMIVRQCGVIYSEFILGRSLNIPLDVCPILHGEQGKGKSRFCRWLAFDPDRYTEVGNTNDFSSPDFYRALSGKMIAENGELSATRKSDQEKVKGMISKTHFEYTQKYKEGTVKTLRISSIIGTTNEDLILKDLSGNRRFFTIWLSDISQGLFNDPDLAACVWAWGWAKVQEMFSKGESIAMFDTVQELESVYKSLNEHILDRGIEGDIVDAIIADLEENIKENEKNFGILPIEFADEYLKRQKRPPSRVDSLIFAKALRDLGYKSKLVGKAGKQRRKWVVVDIDAFKIRNPLFNMIEEAF